jgi:hypothetical protein
MLLSQPHIGDVEAIKTHSTLQKIDNPKESEEGYQDFQWMLPIY